MAFKAVTVQPGSVVGYAPSDFQTGLLDCGSDCGTCFLGLCCPCILGCTIASAMDECCLCGLSVAMRGVYRTKYNINGSMCRDYITYLCCFSCATCQLKRDINKRKEQGIF